MKRFQIRYDEGTDVYTDPDYIRWLELYHSESLPADHYSLTSAIASTDESLQTSLAEHFCSITPEVPIDSVDTVFTSDADLLHSNALISADKPRDTCQEVSPISKFLVSPLPATPAVPETSPRARLLTSTQCLAQLEEKRRQKQLAIQEKEQGKLEQEEMKSKREQEQKQKAEERVKAEEKARKVKEMAEKKTKKAAEKERKAAERVAKKHQRKVGGANKNPTAEATDEPPQKKKHREVCPRNDVDSDEDMCCICFGTYTDDVREQSGRDWIKCACSRWLHEDCMEDYKVDDSGEDRFCHYCLDMLDY